MLRRSTAYRLARRSHTTCLQWPLSQDERFSGALQRIEKHWREHAAVPSRPRQTNGSSKYVLAQFPYPSGTLHMGHLRVYTISDVLARYYRLGGHDVVHPIGWDAFGLPAENAARERGFDPAEWTTSNVAFMTSQLHRTGVQFDWDREINTSDPEYYRWTQWIFTRMHRAGLVRRGKCEVNWDPVDRTVLAAEQIDEQGRSWRSGAVAEKRRMHTWLIETPKYAKRLYDGLSALRGRWHEVEDIQRHWIGKCDVHRFRLPIQNADGTPTEEIFDLRIQDPLSLPGAAFILVSSTDSLVRGDERAESGEPFISSFRVLNGVTGEWLPLVVVPKEYLDGTRRDGNAPMYHLGARLAHPTADRDLAASLGLPLRPQRTTMPMGLADVEEIAAFGGYGGYVTSRTLHDWAVSRQRAWGTPIPMIIPEKGDAYPMADDTLPLLSSQRGGAVSTPSGTGAFEVDTLDTFFDSAWYFLRFLDPRNKQCLADPSIVARRMPVDVYVGGVEHAALHLYYARFFSYFLADIGAATWPEADTAEPFRTLVPQGIVRWKTYTEASTGRYVRENDVDFSGSVPRVKAAPEHAEVAPGTELTMQYEKMSKSKHNGINPITVLDQDGIDMARLQLLDTAAPRAPIDWGQADLSGLRRWLDRVAWVVNAYVDGRKGLGRGEKNKEVDAKSEEELREAYNFFVRNVSMTVEVLHLLNTAIARLQGLTNALRKTDPSTLANSEQGERALYALVTMMQIFAPHAASELHGALKSVQPIAVEPAERMDEQPWPQVDADAAIDFSLHVNGVNCGRVRADRAKVERLSPAELLSYGSSSEHGDLLAWLQTEGRREGSIEVKGREGFFVALELQIADAATGKMMEEERIRTQLDRLAKERSMAMRKEKGKKVKKAKK